MTDVDTLAADIEDEIDAALAIINAGNQKPVTVADNKAVADEGEEEELAAASLIDIADSELDALLAGLIVEELPVEPAVEAEVEDDGDDEVIESDISIAMARIEAEAAANSAPAAVPEVEAEVEAVKTTRKRKPAEPKAPPPQTRDFTDVAAIDKATLNDNLNACKAIKVTEKAMNVIQAIQMGKRLSRYTADAVRLLEKNGSVTAKALVEDFIAQGLKEGTAKAQSQQMTALFKMLGIALPGENDARTLVVSDKGLLDELVKLAA